MSRTSRTDVGHIYVNLDKNRKKKKEAVTK